MTAFYTFAPGGDAFGQNDIEDNPDEGPGFSVPGKVGLSPFFRRNAGDPTVDGRFLTREEIIERQKIYSVTINELQDVQ